jgi:cephalosporin hydroxylase
MTEFEKDVAERLAAVPANTSLQAASQAFMDATIASRYSYNFFWLGRPIIQYPQDVMAMQELIWRVRPDIVVETGIAHGGSLILSASILALLDMCDAASAGEVLDPAKPKRRVVGVDIDIRPHNRAAIEAHPMAGRIDMIQGSSIAPGIVADVREHVKAGQRVMVCLDSNHTHEHVLAELDAYAGLTSVGSYCVVFDTIVERLAPECFPDRPWGPGDNPMTAVNTWLETHPEFEIDESIDRKLLVSVAPRGFLRRVA